MSVSLKCDMCEEACPEPLLPAQFEFDEIKIEITATLGKGSPDICARCLADIFVRLAISVAPQDIRIEWKRVPV